MPDARVQFADVIRAAGMKPPDAIEPGTLHRFPGKDKRNGNTAAWCKLFADGLGGVFGDFSTDFSDTWQAKRDKPLSQAEREAFKCHVEKAKAETKAERAQSAANAAERARQIWNSAKPASDSHAYLTRKAVKAHELRIYRGPLALGHMPLNGCLIIPARGTDGQIYTLEFIHPELRNGDNKRFLFGGDYTGRYFAIGTPKGAAALCIAEGLATGATIHETTGHPVAVAFNAGNLEPVARALRAKLPDLRLILCADDDAATPGNPGVTKATAAARSVGGLVAKPNFGANRPAGVSDFNDMRQLCGAEAVVGAIEGASVPAEAEQQPAEENAPAGDSDDVARGEHPAAETQERAAGNTTGANAEARARGESPEPAITEWPASLDLEALAEHEPELPRFIIPDWLPAGYATLLAGHGGIGKSAIALHLAVCAAAGVPLFGLEVGRRRVLYLSCEDRESVLHWRLSRICRHLGVDLARLRGWLEVIDLVGRNSVLFERDPRTGNVLTAAYGTLDERMRNYQAELLIVDGISDVFGGNENARTEVKRFCNSLVAMIPPDTGAVLLVGHVSKPGSMAGASGEGYSGSTGWHNSARARWYLFPEVIQGEDDERAERTGDLILELQKSNLGRTDQSIRFAWDDDAHLFVGREIIGATAFDRAHRDRTERQGILAALKACAVSNPPIVVPTAMTGQRTAFHVLSQRLEFPETLRAGRPAKRRFWRQIESLRQIRAIAEAQYKRTDRHLAAQLTITTEGMRECGE